MWSTADAIHAREPRLANRSLTMQANAMTLGIEDYALIGD
jgi:hypothetical protein